MRFTIRVLLALAAGLLLGSVVAHLSPGWMRIPAFFEPVGTMYINAIRISVIPMIMASLIVGVASATKGQMEDLGGRALAVIAAGLVLAVLFSGAAALLLFSRIHVDAGLAAGLGTKAVAAPPSLAKWFVDLIPSNIMSALADGSLLPLVLFSFAFGLALAAVEKERREPVVRFLQGIADAFTALMTFIVRLAPLGVFALAVPLAAHTGIGSAGTLAYYDVVMSAIFVGFLAIVGYPAVVALGHIPFSRFSKAASASEAIAVTSRSSMASLPVVYTGARDLGLSEQDSNFLLPLLASVFKIGSAMQQVVGVIFLAKVTGVSLGVFQLATLAVSSIAISFTVPGIPGGSILVMAPSLASVGVPVSGMALLLAVDAIPDMFRTVANVMGWLMGAALIARKADANPLVPVHGNAPAQVDR